MHRLASTPSVYIVPLFVLGGMDAIISDIHGNVEALNAALAEIRKFKSTRIICLGDLVCYGPDSLECIRKSATWDVVIAGDWDLAMIEYDASQWPPTISEHIERTRQQIHSAVDADALLAILGSYRQSFIDNGRHLCHGTPDDVREWVFPEDVYDAQKLNRIAMQFDSSCICGHSHMQGIFKRRDTSEEWEFIQPVPSEPYELDSGGKTIVIAGSVGQPRDGDPRASFLTIEGNYIQFHRVEYDVAATVNKIHASPDIDNMQGDRLLYGR